MLVNLIFHNNIPIINGELCIDGNYKFKIALKESLKWNPIEIEDALYEMWMSRNKELVILAEKLIIKKYANSSN